MTLGVALSGGKGLGNMSDEEYRSFANSLSLGSRRANEINGIMSGGGASGGSGIDSTLGGFGGTGINGIDDLTNRAKDLAKFRLGLDMEQARGFRNLREEEQASESGRRIRETQEQFAGQERLTNLTQSALTGRLEKELSNRLAQQEREIGQQNLSASRAIGLASRRLGRR